MQDVAAKAYAPTAILTWLGSPAKRGERLEYHRGYLPIDMHPLMSKLREPDIGALISVKRTAWDLYMRRLATLVQRRHGDFDYSYFIVKS